MRPLPPAPFFKDSADAIRDANEEGIRRAEPMRKKHEAMRKELDRVQRIIERENEREQSSESLFLPQDDDPETLTQVGPDTVSYGPFFGLKSARKRVHESESPEVSSGPFMGLTSAKKRVRETESLEERSEQIFDSAKEVAVDESVNDKEGSTTSFGPRKKIAKKAGTLKNVQVMDSRAMKQGPDWYAEVDTKQTFARGDLQDLKYLNTLVKNAIKDAADGNDLSLAFHKISQRLQAMEFFTCLSQILVKKSGLLDDGGFDIIFENRAANIDFPFYVRADADILYRKWMSKQIDPHLFRGIVTKKGTGKEDKGFKSHSIEPTFPGKVSCNYVGAGNLVNGQWWPLQMCSKRDGAHGEIEAGIHGQKDQGAYSVVVSGGGYANIDTGDIIKYCGTQGSPNSPSLGTTMMLKAHETQQSLRVLRSSSLPATNPYRPVRGIRYDGLYQIISYEILSQQTAMHRFTLSRLGGQDPIRYNGEGMIPSNVQITELNKIRSQLA